MSLGSFQSATEISRNNSAHSSRHSRHVDQLLLRPEDAFSAQASPRKRSGGHSETVTVGAQANVSLSDAKSRREQRRGRSSSQRRRSAKDAGGGKGQWKKLLWVKQSYPDNYTDEETFLDDLQMNPRLRPYEFWPLVADSTIIVQHVCSVVIFVCCFTAIFQERVSPQTVVGWATTGTVAGWVIKEHWQSREEAEVAAKLRAKEDGTSPVGGEEDEKGSMESSSESPEYGMPFKEQHVPLATTPNGFASQPHSRISSMNSVDGGNSNGHITNPMSASNDITANGATNSYSPINAQVPPWTNNHSTLSPRMQERLATAKSAILIYCSLLGLSPILKSLTSSTSEDSIWAISSWLMILNVFTFDYGAGPESKFPASLSTNAALMASTVLASRLSTIIHVFSLTLFSIEVFGLFPVFRRHLRHHSWNGHLWLTTFLVIFASGGLSMTISGGGYIMGAVGVVLGGVICGLIMGLTSWWLIGLQRYKNEIRGPWDPARPVLRGVWD